MLKSYISIFQRLTGLTLAFLFGAILFISSCKSDDENVRIFEAAFSLPGGGLAEANATAQIVVRFSTPVVTQSKVVIEVEETGLTYGTEYETSPTISNGLLEVTVEEGAESASFTVTRLVEFIESGKSLTFTLLSIDSEEDAQLVGNTSYALSFEKVISSSGVIDLLTGGSTYANQCYIDLSTGTQKAVRRDSWELGFYNGTDNRVLLNAAIKASAAQITGVTDINAVTSEMVFSDPFTLYYYPDFSTKTPVSITKVSDLFSGLPVGYSQYGDIENDIVFTDGLSGDLSTTAINEISTIASENYVYIVALGFGIPETAAEPGKENHSGDQRGYMKVRILTDGNTYTIQYAEIDATTYQEATISKDGSTGLTTFSLTEGKVVDSEPKNHDLNIGVFSNFNDSFGFGAGLSYTDYGVHNTLGGVGVYQLNSEEIPGSFGAPATPANTETDYDNFTLADVDDSKLVYDDRTVIASNWRSTSEGIAYNYIYYIIKDADDNYYKLQFTALVSESGERGYSQFKYALLQ